MDIFSERQNLSPFAWVEYEELQNTARSIRYENRKLDEDSYLYFLTSNSGQDNYWIPSEKGLTKISIGDYELDVSINFTSFQFFNFNNEEIILDKYSEDIRIRPKTHICFEVLKNRLEKIAGIKI